MPHEFDLPELVRSLVESLAKFMAADRGHWTIELMLEDGKFSRYRMHYGPAGAKTLGRVAVD